MRSTLYQKVNRLGCYMTVALRWAIICAVGENRGCREHRKWVVSQAFCSAVNEQRHLAFRATYIKERLRESSRTQNEVRAAFGSEYIPAL